MQQNGKQHALATPCRTEKDQRELGGDIMTGDITDCDGKRGAGDGTMSLTVLIYKLLYNMPIC